MITSVFGVPTMRTTETKSHPKTKFTTMPARTMILFFHVGWAIKCPRVSAGFGDASVAVIGDKLSSTIANSPRSPEMRTNPPNGSQLNCLSFTQLRRGPLFFVVAMRNARRKSETELIDFQAEKFRAQKMSGFVAEHQNRKPIRTRIKMITVNPIEPSYQNSRYGGT